MKKIVENEKVFCLKACYKDNDDEDLGAFDSMEALMRFFARTVIADHKGEDPGVVAETIAVLAADLLGEGDNDECVDGCTRYWINEMEVMGVIDVADDDPVQEEPKKGKRK